MQSFFRAAYDFNNIKSNLAAVSGNFAVYHDNTYVVTTTMQNFLNTMFPQR